MKKSKNPIPTDLKFSIKQFAFPVLLVNQKLTLLDVNEQTLHLFKRKRFNAHHNFTLLLHQSERENFADFFQDILKRKRKRGFDEFRLNSKANQFVLALFCQVKLDKIETGYLIFLLDVTGRKNNIEQLRDLLGQKEELFARIHYYQQEILKMVVESEEKERKMIADNIHDRLGSLMASIRLHLEYYETI